MACIEPSHDDDFFLGDDEVPEAIHHLSLSRERGEDDVDVWELCVKSFPIVAVAFRVEDMLLWS